MNRNLKICEDVINPHEFTIKDLTDEIRVDDISKTLLKRFHQYLLGSGTATPLQAGSLAAGADYFLRDFVIDSLRCNIFRISAAQVKGFAGNWYIHRNLEPNLKELSSILEGVSAFYRFCAEQGWTDPALATEIATSCRDMEYYRRRIEGFDQLKGDDYPDWCAECPVSGT